MEIIEFKKVLEKSIDIVNIGVKKGYFDENKKEELNNKLKTMFKNGIVYDLPGTAIYGMYSSDEKKLYFNAKVFKTEEEALVYILHEIKHGLDHYDEIIGFEYQDKGVGINEGATQRFATDMTEEILQIKFPRERNSSLGINFNTHLDEYQIEDKLNELFCIAMNISMEDFIKMQNDPQKIEYKKLINKFNQHASYEAYKQYLDEIYKLQEETWFDDKNNILETEKEPTPAQTQKAIELIGNCKRMILKYAKEENPGEVDNIKKVSFTATNEYGEIIRDDDGKEEYNQQKMEERNKMEEQDIVSQADYMNYQKRIIKQIGSKVLNNECTIIFVTEFKYEESNDEKIVYFRKGNSYQKLIVPMKGDKTIDISNISVEKVNDLNEILLDIEDCEAEFQVIANAPEYAKILNMIGKEEKAQIILNKWNYFLSKQDELEQIRSRVEESSKAFQEEIESLAYGKINSEQEEYFDNLFKKEIEYKNIRIDEHGIIITRRGGSSHFIPSPKEEEQYINQVKNAFESGEIALNRVQQNLLESYLNGNIQNRIRTFR